MEKVFCMQVAAQLTIAACNGLGAGANRPIDASLKDPTQRACNLEVWEIFRAFYVAITQAVADNTNWPSPIVDQGNTLPGVLSSGIQAALPALSTALGAGPLGNILGAIVKALPTPVSVPTITGSIPNPGAVATSAGGTAK